MLRRAAPALLLLLLGFPGLLPAQYFGRNKVQYTNFDFKVIQTEHFDVYFYERERVAAMDAARMAERSYARLSKVLNHEFRERKPIILYASHSDFMQTNATQVGGEGTGGVTDFARNRAVMPFTGSYSDFEHVLMHEMVHQFQYDVWSRGPGRRRLRHAGGDRAAALVRRRHGRVPLHRPDQRRDGDVAPRRVARRQAADHRPDDGGSVRVLPVPLRPRPLVLCGRALGRRGGRRDPQGHAGGRRRARLPAHHRAHAGAALRPVARRGPEALPAGDRRAGAGPGRSQTSC